MKNNILDAYLKNKVESFEPALEEEQWLHALAALEEDEKDNKKPFPWLRTAGLVAMLLLTGALAYVGLNLGSRATHTRTAATTEQSNAVTSNQTAPTVEPSQAANSASMQQPTTAVMPAEVVDVQNNESSLQVQQPYTATAVTANTSNNYVNNTTVKNTAAQPTVTPVRYAQSNSNNRSARSTKRAIDANTQANAQALRHFAENTSNETTAADLLSAATQNKILSQAPQISKPATNSQAQSNALANVEQVLEQQSVNDVQQTQITLATTHNTTTNAAQTTTASKNNTTATEYVLPADKPSTTQLKVTPSVAKATEQNIPTESQSTKPSDKPKIKSIKKLVQALAPTVELGSSLVQSPLNLYNNRHTINASPAVTIGWKVQANKKLGIYFGTGYTKTRGLSFEFFQSYNGIPAREPGSYQTIDRSITQLMLPIRAYYQVHPKHAAIAGLTTMVPLRVTQDAGIFMPPNTQYKRITVANQNYNTQYFATLGYEVNVVNHVRFYTHYLFGLNDFTNAQKQPAFGLVMDRCNRVNAGVRLSLGK